MVRNRAAAASLRQDCSVCRVNDEADIGTRYEGSLTRTTAFATDAWRAFAKHSVNVAARGARWMGGTARAAICFQ